MKHSNESRVSALLARHGTTIAAVVFVLVWSTGFIVARGVAPLADPSLFLAVRFALCAALFLALARWLSAPLPSWQTALKLAGIGALLQGVYLCAGFWAVGEGMQPGIMALIGALQPPLTAAIAARLYGERLSAFGWLGLLLGIAGVALAVWPSGSVEPVRLTVLLAALASVSAITAGTLLQKGRVAAVALMPSSAVQNVGAFAVALLLFVMLGEHRAVIGADLLLLLAYAVGVLSLGGTTLLIWLVRTGNVTQATSLFFVAPPLAALLAWLLFDEPLGPVQLAGFVVACLGVWLSRR